MGTRTLVTAAFVAQSRHEFEDAVIRFWLWYANDFVQPDSDEGSLPSEDVFVVDISSDHGGSWTNLLTLGPDGEGTTGGWIRYAFRVSDYVVPTNRVFVRFRCSTTSIS